MELDGDGATRSLQVTPVPGGGVQHYALTPRSARELRERKSDPGSPAASPRTEERSEMMILGVALGELFCRAEMLRVLRPHRMVKEL